MTQTGSTLSTEQAQPAQTAAAAGHAALIALDWGTTSLRAYLYDANGAVLETRASTAGIMNLPRPAAEGGFDAAFDAVVGAWLDRTPELPVIAAGMVGSAQGWKEAPYVNAPASADAEQSSPNRTSSHAQPRIIAVRLPDTDQRPWKLSTLMII